MSSTDSTVSVVPNPARRRRRSKEKPPLMRIVLLGKDVSVNSRVGNFMLGRSAFESESPPDDHHCTERVRGQHMTLINCPHLLQHNLSSHLITQTLRECVSLSHPGPHVIVLIFKHDDECSTEDQEHVDMILNSFSDSVYEHTLVLTTHHSPHTDVNDNIQEIIRQCLNKHYKLEKNSSPSKFKETLEKIVQRNSGRHLMCEESLTMKQQTEERDVVELNVVVCGSDRSFISRLMLNESSRRSEMRSDCVMKREMEVCGRLINLLELPALFNTSLSDDEVMRQTLCCLSLCHPGVHVFLLIIPHHSFTDEHKAEMQEIHRIFSSRIRSHMMILIMQKSEDTTAELDDVTQSVINGYAAQCHFIHPNTQVSTLLERIQQMIEDNKGASFSTQTFLNEQMKKMKDEEMKKQIHLPDLSEIRDEVRIVLLGKTGVGKSATGNTILGREAFLSEESFESVTSECQKHTAKINNRSVTVIDTPGLFDTELSQEEIQREMTNCISMILPGPHVFLLLVPLGRFTKEEATAVKIIQETFGEMSFMYTMVLFTRGDFLKKKTIEEWLGKPGSPLRKLIEECGNRYHVFNNTETEDRTQVSDLLEKIDHMVTDNEGSYYSCKRFREMEREKQEQHMKTLMERIEELNREKEEERERMKMMMEEETQKHERERKTREEEIREREESYKRERKVKEEERERMKMMMEEETQKHARERKTREEEIREREERYKRERKEKEEKDRQMRDEINKEQETFKSEISELKKENKDLMMKYNTQTDKLINTIENHERERKRREEEIKEREERYKREIQEKEEKDRQMRDEINKEQETFRIEINELKLHNEEYETEIKRIMKDLENERQNVEERKRRETEYSEREEQYKTEIKEMRRERDSFKSEISELKKENKDLLMKYNTQTDKLMNTIENHERERKRREEEIKEREERYKSERKEKERMMLEDMRREREEWEKQRQEEKVRREEDENKRRKEQGIWDECNQQLKQEIQRHEEERERMKMMIEEETQKHKGERKTREEEIIQREETYKREIQEKEEKERMMLEDTRREREEWEKQRQEEKVRREEDEKEKQIHVEQCERLKREMMREKERIEREKQHQLEEFEKRVQEERNMREEQEKNFEEQLRLLKEESEDQLKRRTTELREEYKRQKEEIIKICPQSQDAIQISAYRRLETEYSRWSWTLHGAMIEIQIKLHNKIENEAIHEIEERDLERELKQKSDEVNKSMSEFFETDTDAETLIQWKTSFEIKIKELQENIVRETKKKLNEILQQRDLKREIDAQRTQHENTLLEKSKELALRHKDKRNDEETVKREFDVFWEECVKKITSDSPPIKDIDILRDVRELLRDIYKSVHVDQWKDIRNIFTVQSYSDYVQFKKSSGINAHLRNVYRAVQDKFGYSLSKEDEAQIRTFITDVSYHTDEMIQSFNISKMGYNINCIQQLTDHIKTRITDYEKEPVKYVFKREFFIDLVFSIFKRSNKTFTDQHRMFREANDPVLYLEKKKREYYSVFQKYCHGATSAAIFGEIICQKLKEPIEQSVYRQTARDLADEMRSNCPSLNGNRSNLEKNILKRLAEEENFDKYMDYIKNPRDHFKSFIRDEVSQYIRDQFSVQLKMNQNIKFLQKKIMTAAQESTQRVQQNRGNVDVWLKCFTLKLSDVLMFSVKDFSGVKHDDVDDFKLLEDVIRTELPPVMSDISREFSTDSFNKKLDVNNRADEIVIDHLCRCCWVQCPFCKAVCTNTIEFHDGDHSVTLHRVTGINGEHYHNTQNLSVDFCTTVSENWYNYSEHRSAGGVYAEWSITPDLSYWKWFVCRFQKDLEGYYKKTFQGDGKIPEEWREITRQKAIESLDTHM